MRIVSSAVIALVMVAGSARRARAAASDVAAAATAGDGSRVMKARSTMTATCMPCHGVYREGDAQTGYRIKAGAI